MSHDSNGDFYWPVASDEKANHVRKLNKADGSVAWQHSINEDQQTYSVAFPPTTPLYNDDSVTGQEFLYLTSNNGGDSTLPQIRKLRLVDATQDIADGSNTRASTIVTVSNGDINVANKADGASLATDGAGALSSLSPYVSVQQAFNKVYFSDGVNYKVLDPTVGTNGTVTDWTADKAGSVPERGKLLTLWRGRMVIANTADDPHAWHMSAIADPHDWDQFPSTPVATQAISGAQARCGKTPDIVNGIAPLTDDLMVFGGDHSLWRLTGDPMAGGQFDLISDKIGMAFGRAWCKSKDGYLFFFSTQGGVYSLAPNGQMTSLTDQTISRRLESIDLSKYRVELVWNDSEQGLHLFQIPYHYAAIDRLSYFWDSRLNAWFEDSFATSSMQISASAVTDGDNPNDRELLLGSQDGYVRYWDRTASHDDGSTVESYATIGPIVAVEQMSALRFTGICPELASNQDGARVEIFVSPSADDKGVAIKSVDVFSGGRGGMINSRAKGAALWVKLKNVRPKERWALEALSTSIYRAGRKRVR